MFLLGGVSIADIGRGGAIGKKRDPLSVGRPLEAAIATGIGEQNWGTSTLTVDPYVTPETVVIPIRPASSDEDGITIGGNLDRRDSYAVEEFVEGDTWQLLSH